MFENINKFDISSTFLFIISIAITAIILYFSGEKLAIAMIVMIMIGVGLGIVANNIDMFDRPYLTLGLFAIGLGSIITSVLYGLVNLIFY